MSQPCSLHMSKNKHNKDSCRRSFLNCHFAIASRQFYVLRGICVLLTRNCPALLWCRHPYADAHMRQIAANCSPCAVFSIGSFCQTLTIIAAQSDQLSPADCETKPFLCWSQVVVPLLHCSESNSPCCWCAQKFITCTVWTTCEMAKMHAIKIAFEDLSCITRILCFAEMNSFHEKDFECPDVLTKCYNCL
jgi:hypothetical protein